MLTQLGILIFGLFSFSFVCVMIWLHIKTQAKIYPMLKELVRRYLTDKASLSVSYSNNVDGVVTEVLNVFFEGNIVVFTQEDDLLTLLRVNNERYHFPYLKREFLRVINQMFEEERSKRK